ncbi:CAPAR-like protein [Mya arenaria]|uniref:CAPAR-like protein n=1 Tax=Mya arenaria TaxID=6604 RepID=A0ABY7ED12_MYAAR|nr:CAPAR-like protein [Mya arenaria]
MIKCILQFIPPKTLPPEAYSIYESYPWRFGKIFCYTKIFLQEMTSYASVLTITAFTVERYVAICHPLKAHKFASLSRSIKIIIGIWVISLVCALPYPIYTEQFYFIGADKNNGTAMAVSLICNIPERYHPIMMYIFQCSTFLFFVFPLTIIMVLYMMIALSLRHAALQRVASQESKSNNGTPVSQSGKSVFRMLMVVAFFICWAPFHAQRLLTIYNKNWTPLLLHIQSALFYISGVLYFVSSTVNPILYNVMSKRYREAFKDTICHCRRKRTLHLRHSGLQKSYYCSVKHSRPPSAMSIVRRSENMCHVVRSDTQQTQISFPLNGNNGDFDDNDPMRDSLIETPCDDISPVNKALRKSWANSKQKAVCCSVCANEGEVTPSPNYDRQCLLLHKESADSAC